ncbi:MAG: hypothetical protein DRG78_01060 [Epsilonproteobacteria bacterium]|nr:MAG: hypothetical protein DRG78_01060 [Campylobacterota bacterium]
MNLIFKPFVFNVLIAVSAALFLSQIAGYFIKSYPDTYISKDMSIKDKKFDIVSTLNIVKNKAVSKTTKKKNGPSNRFLLKAFSISGIILDDTNSMTIIRDKSGGKFMQVGETHKGYKLNKIYAQKVIFKKNNNLYFAFLTPDGEKSFKSLSSNSADRTNISKREETTGTVSRAMFNEIKYKKGKYFMPRDLLLEYTTLDKIFSGISIQAQSVNGKLQFKIMYISSNSVFKKMGLRAFDYIVKINGEDFKSVTEPIKYFQNLKNIKALSLTIQRGKKKELKELKYEIY